ncbi:MAG: hypothetical protein ABL967_01965 [Bryobacteraceae bacterium]
MTTTNNYRNGLWEAYRTSFKNFTLAAEKLQTAPAADPIAHEMALEELERARTAHSRSRDALAPGLLGKREPQADASSQPQSYACCA